MIYDLFSYHGRQTDSECVVTLLRRADTTKNIFLEREKKGNIKEYLFSLLFFMI